MPRLRLSGLAACLSPVIMQPGLTRVVPPDSNHEAKCPSTQCAPRTNRDPSGKAGFESAQVSTAFTPGVSQENQALDSWAAVAARTARFTPLPGEFFEKVSIDKLLGPEKGRCLRTAPHVPAKL